MKKLDRVFFIAAALLLCAALLPAGARAAEIAASGTCGENLTWILNDEGTLTISGTGEMVDYNFASSPWNAAGQVKQVVIEEGVTTVGDWAFYGCTELTGVSVAGTVVSIGSHAFAGSGLTELSLPEGVLSVGEYAFYECKSLVSVSLPEIMTNIDEGAFYECLALESIRLPEGIMQISPYCFKNCASLLEIELPESVTKLSESAFYHAGLTEITIPAGVTELGKDALSCENLERIVVAEDNSVFSGDETGALFNKDKTALIKVPSAISGEFTVPEGVKVIGARAFVYCDELTQISLLEGLECIEDEAFYACARLQQLGIPASVTQISISAFASCNRLTGIWAEEESAAYSSDAWGVLFNKDKTCLVKAPEKLSGIYTIPDGVKTIGSYAFASCDLTGVILPESVTAIEDRAFSYCSGLTELLLPGSVESIGAYAFFNCNGLTEMTIPGKVRTIGVSAFFACGGLTKVTVEEGVEEIGSMAFGLCSSLTAVTLPESLKFVGEQVFYESAAIEYNVYDGGLYLGTEKNPYAALLGASSDAVTSVTVHEDAAVMADCAFSEHPNLTEISLPGKITRIPDYAFYQCEKLQGIVIPEGVTTIDYRAFFGCTGLENVTIPASVTQMDDQAFFGCPSLSDVYIYDASAWCKIQSEAGQILNQNGDQLPRLHIMDADGNELTHIVLDDTVTEIPDWAFASTTATQISIASSVMKIGAYAFWDAAITNVDYKGTLAQWYAIEMGVCNDTVLHGTLTVECIDSPEHSWDEGVITEDATCVRDGSKLYTCTICEFQKTEVIEHTNIHILNEGYISVNATCKDPGERVFDCKHCSYRTVEPIEKTDHTFGDWISADDSTHMRICDVCGGEETQKHSWSGGGLTLWPTCGAEGEKQYYCSLCNKTKTETVPKLTEHQQWGDWTRVDDTTHMRACNTCGATETGTHSWGDGRITKDPTCGEEGEMTYQCTVCCCEKTEPIEKDPEHQWNDGFISRGATCISEGVMTYTCYVCGLTRTEPIPVLTEHYWNGWVEESDGSHKNVCLTCGATETAAHSWDEGTVAMAPTCGAEGEMTYTCTVCYRTKFEAIPKLTDHTWDSGQITQGATCLNPGVMTWQCDVCGERKTEEIPRKTEHYWNGWVKESDGSHKNVCLTCGATETAAHSWDSAWTDRAPTCAEEGIRILQCSVCGGTKTEAIEKLTTHSWDSAWQQVSGSEHSRTCLLCGAVETAAHSWDNSWVSVIPTCGAEGQRAYQCSGCYATKTEAIEKLTNHSFGSWSAVDGSSHKSVCAVCQKEEDRAHSWDSSWVEKEPTCAEAGLTGYLCAACGYIKTVEIPKLTTHSWDSGAVTKQPTCREDGVKTYTCAVCDETRTEAVAKHTNHSWDAGAVNKKPTCKEEGVKIYTCAVCGGTKAETIEKLTTHSWDGGVVTKEATRETEGVKTYTCAVCGEAKTEAIAKITAPESITSATHTVSGDIISNIATGTTTEKLIENINEGQYVKIYSGTEEVAGDALLGTGMTVKIMDGDRVVTEVTAVVTGDTNGDGKISITDLLSAKAHLLKKDTLEGAYAQGGDTNGDGNITITDFLQMKAHILGKSQIEAQPVVPAPAEETEREAAVTVATVTEAFVPGKKSLLAI